MAGQFSQDTSTKPRVVIFSAYNPLALSVVEMLLQKQCEVILFSKETDLWRENTSHIESPQLIVGDTVGGFSRIPDYIIVFAPNPGIEMGALLSKGEGASKIFFVCPTQAGPGWRNALVNTIYVRDLYGPRMEFGRTGLSFILAQAAAGGPSHVPTGSTFYPTYIQDAAKEIVRMLLSFGPPSGEILILGEELTSEHLAEALAAAGLKTAFSGSRENGALPRTRTIKTKTQFREGLKETLEWGRRHGVHVARVKKSKPPKRPIKIGKTPLFLGIALFLLPFILLIVSAAALLAGKNFLLKANTSAASNASYLARGTSRGASFGLGLYALIPLAGELFRPFSQASNIIEKSSEIMIQGADVVEGIGDLGEKILGDEVYDPAAYSQEIYLTLDNLYQEMGFLDGEIKEQKGVLGYVASRVLKDNNLADMRTKILQLKNLFADAPKLLGKGKPSAYLLLFQNNMELRPAGGFIGSLAIVTFDGGRLSDVNVQDVYSLDGQLKGHVDPPEPIKDHLGEANWFLRDSNWDPDFPVSASRAEWFLGKEIGKSVDGVISLDLEAAKSILGLTGPVALSDFGLEINADNLYEKTQSEVEESFFPGSQKKAGFLTALARALLQEVLELPSQKNASLAKALVDNLESRHVQIFLHQKEAQRAISALGFDGSFQVPACSGNCYSDFLGVVEANVGVNKANYFIKRYLDMDTNFEGDSVLRRLSITFENSANSALGLSGRYKVYLRIFVPIDSEVGEPLVGQGEEVSGFPADIKDTQGKREVGLLVEVLPGQTKTVSFSWSGESPLTFDQNGEYRLYWRKQSGTDKDPVSLRITSPQAISATPSSGASLTRDGSFIYNTNLARDLFSRISW